MGSLFSQSHGMNAITSTTGITTIRSILSTTDALLSCCAAFYSLPENHFTGQSIRESSTHDSVSSLCNNGMFLLA